MFTWDYVRVRIEYSARQELEKGSIALRVFSKEQHPLIMCATQPVTNLPLFIKVGRSLIDCVFPKWPLAAGEYDFGVVSAMPLIKSFFRDDHLCGFKVSAKDVYHSGHPPLNSCYFVAPEHHWEVPSG